MDESKRTTLKGNTHPLTRSAHDLGVADKALPMNRMRLILRRSTEQQAELDAFLAEQMNPTSVNFHHWLTPKEFGQKYGPSDADIQVITYWLQSNGFTIDRVSNGRVFIEFSGTADAVSHAFRTEIHRYQTAGEEHIANSADPSIPEALKSVVVGVQSLHNFQMKHLHHNMAKTSVAKLNTKPLFNVGGAGGYQLVTPYDFATIYNVLPLWSAGVDGTGQTIAIAGRSDITLSDVATFRSAFGLPANVPTVIVNGTDPGVPTTDDQEENTLDVEWSGAVAKGATIKFVTTASTNSSDGAISSATYIIDNQTAPVMSFSYGQCELQMGAAGNTAMNLLWQQGAAEGISIFVASGDQGSAGCDGGGSPPEGATFGLQVSGVASTPYNIAVGGTDFNWANNSSVTYWNASNSLTNLSSALGYIPEIPWNSSCASLAVDQAIGTTALGYSQQQTCSLLLQDGFDLGLITIVGGGGGQSACTNPSDTTAVSCSGGYAKPAWQTGVGVPADGKRDLPDVSLFAASGLLGSAYVICDSALSTCDYTSSNNALSQAVGGTSVASPAMAGIMALVNQKLGTPQGNANVAFYALAAQDNRANCNSVSVGAGNGCNFYDITTDTNAMPCIPGSINCVSNGYSVGVLSGYSSTTGYDLTTGLGSVNAYNLVNNWALTYGNARASLTPPSLAMGTLAVGTQSTAQTLTLTNSGIAPLTISTISLGGANPGDFGQTNNCGTSLGVSASCSISVTFKPTASGSRTASVVVTDNSGGVSGATQSSTLSGTGAATTVPAIVSVSPSSGTGATQMFTAVYSDALGASDISSAQLLFNTSVNGTNACWLVYSASAGTITLQNNAGNAAAGSVTPGTTGSVSNGQCTLSGTGTLVTSSGTTLSMTVALTFNSGLVGLQNTYLYAAGSQGSSGFIQKGSWTPAVPGTPSVVSLSPSAGAGLTQTFTTVYSDTSGVSDLSVAHLLFNASVNGSNACWVIYSPATSTLTLQNNAGNGAAGAFVIGSTASISNSQCSVAGTGTTAVVSGNNLTLTVALTFTSAFTGTQNVYMYGVGSAGNTGWTQKGTWTPVGSASPTATSLSPSSGSGLTQAFTAVYTDPLGASDLSVMHLLFNGSVNGTNACWLIYSPATSSVTLQNNVGNGAAGAVTIGSSSTVANSQCTLSGTGTAVVKSGNTVTLTLALTFTSSFIGTQNVYLYGAGSAGNTGWTQKGTWTPVGSGSPTISSLTPGSGTGLTQTFTAVYTDPLGASDLSSVHLLFNGAVNGTNACWLIYSPATSAITLQNDTGSAAAGSITVGSSGSVSNSQCTLSGTAVSITGNNLTMTVALSFTSNLAGSQNVYLYAAGSTGNSGWVQKGSWNVAASGPPTIVSLNPASGSGLTQTFTAVYSDPSGTSDLSNVHLLINTSVNGTGACWVIYSPATNTMTLKNDAGSGTAGSFVVGSTSSVSNGQCTLAGSGTTASSSSTNLTLTFALTFTGTFTGAQNAYLYAAGSAGNSGWVQKGTWTP